MFIVTKTKPRSSEGSGGLGEGMMSCVNPWGVETVLGRTPCLLQNRVILGSPSALPGLFPTPWGRYVMNLETGNHINTSNDSV